MGKLKTLFLLFRVKCLLAGPFYRHIENALRWKFVSIVGNVTQQRRLFTQLACSRKSADKSEFESESIARILLFDQRSARDFKAIAAKRLMIKRTRPKAPCQSEKP